MGAHVQNLTQRVLTVTNQNGEFRINASLGDSLLITSVGYKPLIISVDNNWPDEGMVFFMIEGSVELDEVSVFSIPPIEKFKEQILQVQPKDSTFFWYFGVEKPVFKGDKMDAGRVHKKFLYAVLQPANFIYYNVSKSEKEKRKFYQIQRQEHLVDKSELKFTREWVTEHTGYTDEELTSFIAFCDYSPAYLAKTPLYLIMEDMLQKKTAFEKSKLNDEKK